MEDKQLSQSQIEQTAKSVKANIVDFFNQTAYTGEDVFDNQGHKVRITLINDVTLYPTLLNESNPYGYAQIYPKIDSHGNQICVFKEGKLTVNSGNGRLYMNIVQNLQSRIYEYQGITDERDLFVVQIPIQKLFMSQYALKWRKNVANGTYTLFPYLGSTQSAYYDSLPIDPANVKKKKQEEK